MADACMASFGAVAGVAIALAIVCFIIREKRHPDNLPHTAKQ